jgi:hypothetical protein
MEVAASYDSSALHASGTTEEHVSYRRYGRVPLSWATLVCLIPAMTLIAFKKTRVFGFGLVVVLAIAGIVVVA